MAKASINIKSAGGNSMAHNERDKPLHYSRPELLQLNETWKSAEISDKEKEIRTFCKKVSKRKMMKNADPIREGVINLEPHHTIEDLKKLGDQLKEQFGIECFQIHIHKDEGRYIDENGDTLITREDHQWLGPEGEIVKDPEKEFPNAQWKCNNHAHMLFDWQEKDKKIVNDRQQQGKVKRLKPLEMSQIQTLVAESLQMERGELKENSNRQRLEPIEYKRAEEQKRLNKLQLAYDKLEQKKNTIRERNRKTALDIQAAERKIREFEFETARHSEAREQRITEFATKDIQFSKEWLRMDEIEQEELIQDFNEAASRQSADLERQQQEIKQLESEHSILAGRIYHQDKDIGKIKHRIDSVRSRT